ncbi:MAG: FTR1 family protein, partial [Alphaproteobacteria bacterium]
GILSTSKESLLAIVMGSIGGTLAAGTLGFMLYMGLVKFSSKHVFSVTSWFLVLLACGMSAHTAAFFTAADILPVVHHQLWDSSTILAEDSMLGKILHAMLGYTARPTGIQLIFYVCTFIVITALQKIVLSDSRWFRRAATGAAVSSLLAAVILLFSNQRADAAYSVTSPHVEESIFEIELKNSFTRDEDGSKDRFHQHVLGIGYGFTNWWALEIEGELEKARGNGYEYTATEIENKFQFTEPGEYWLDWGAQLSYELKHENQSADKIEAKLLIEKDIGKWAHIANLVLEKQVGTYRSGSTEFEFAWETQYLWMRHLNPGFEYYGGWNEIKRTGNYDNQKHRIGPVLYGRLIEGFKYELGWLIGLSKAAEDHVIKLNVEYEFPLVLY